MPAALLAVCDVASAGLVRDGIVRVEDYKLAFKRLMLQVQPDREDLWFRPLLHVSRHGMWQPLQGRVEVPDNPRRISRLANERQAERVADEIRLDANLARTLADETGRRDVARLVHSLLRGDHEGPSTRLADVHEHVDASREQPDILQELLEYEHRREDRDAFDDLRQRRLAERVVRDGQPMFRRQLLSAYACRCCMSGADAPRALEAAHIIPFRGDHSNRVQNGLLLRRDLHTLFDEGLLTVDVGAGMALCVDRELDRTVYAGFAGVQVASPRAPEHHPDRDALDWHRRKNTD